MQKRVLTQLSMAVSIFYVTRFHVMAPMRAPKITHQSTTAAEMRPVPIAWATPRSQRRCLVPASSYCEPKGEKPAMWHWFALNGDDQRPLFAFPGVWTRYRGPLKKNGPNVNQEVFACMTTEPNALTASINHERMPVLISDPADFETWLSGSTEDAFKLARSYAAEQMRIVQFGAEREDLLRVA
jgi:putative SOS response-associated peptidase YedK